MHLNLKVALRYAAYGLHVLPTSRDKRPLIAGGVHSASCDPKTINTWWRNWPDANIAIATGPISNLLVVDVDPRNGGFYTLGELQFQHEFLQTTCARTGSNGEHYVYRWPSIPDGYELSGKLGNGIDVLGAGRYFLVWPSESNTGAYRWINQRPMDDISCAPEWLVRLLTRPITRRITSEPQSTARSHADTATISQLVERARRYVDAVPPAVSGHGGHTHTFVLAQKLVHGFGLDADTAVSLLTSWNQKCIPPWSTSSLERKVMQAMRKGHYSKKL